jgi:small subunit ribosomal protein S1
MKQAETNPWDLVEQHYPLGTVIEGTVRNLTSYGAFVEIEEGIDGLLHVSDMSWTKKVAHPSEMVKKGDRLQCVVLSVDTEKKRIALGKKQLLPDPWLEKIPQNYHVGDLLSGYVTKITNFGAFVKLEEDLEGLLHISELSDGGKVTNVEDVLRPGMKVEVRVIRVDTDERKIGLSFVHSDFEENDHLPPAPNVEAPADESAPEPEPQGEPRTEPRAEPRSEKKKKEPRPEDAPAEAPPAS